MLDLIFSESGFWTIFTLVFIMVFFGFLVKKAVTLTKEKPRPIVLKED
ncbi:MAG: hypothetical protein ACWA5U_06145 [bacterium]